MDKWIKPIAFLTVLVIFCSVLARFLMRGETLTEYAHSNPDVAFAAPAATGAIPVPASTAGAAASPETAPGSVPEAPAASPAPSPLADVESAESVHYQDGFFYQPLTETVIARITGISYPVPESAAASLGAGAVNVVPDNETLAVSYEDLRYLNVLYYDFRGEVQAGELICNRKIAQDLVEIFYELYLNEYQIERIRLIDEYGGDDTASMADNNTTCFNYRLVDGTASLSKHALGFAIDINPFYNPYVVYNRDGSGETYISPSGSEVYADRSRNFPYKIDENDLCYQLFKAHGFTWGGNWNSSKDYQHFQKVVK